MRSTGAGRTSGFSGSFFAGNVITPKADGLRVAAYAETFDQIEQFKEILEKAALFSTVRLYTMEVSKIDRHSLQSVAVTGTSRGAFAGSLGSSTRETGRAAYLRRRAARGAQRGSRAPSRGLSAYTPGSYGYQSPFQLKEPDMVFAFTIDVQLRT